MDKVLVRNFITQLNKLEGKEYLLSSIAYNIAPTLTGIKPSSLISFSNIGKNIFGLWKDYKEDIGLALNVSFFELRETENSCLVLFYNADMLHAYIASKKSRTFLKKMGYDETMTLEQSLQLLKVRFKEMCPHEIGLFLGIPMEDVRGFIEHKGANFLFCKYWKVYHNVEETKNLFQCYDKAKISVISAMMKVDLYNGVAV